MVNDISKLGLKQMSLRHVILEKVVLSRIFIYILHPSIDGLRLQLSGHNRIARSMQRIIDDPGLKHRLGRRHVGTSRLSSTFELADLRVSQSGVTALNQNQRFSPPAYEAPFFAMHLTAKLGSSTWLFSF
jgi:hypothetical protein